MQKKFLAPYTRSPRAEIHNGGFQNSVKNHPLLNFFLNIVMLYTIRSAILS